MVTALVGAATHVTAEELGELVQVDHPDVAQSTVYRILEELERLGVVDHVHLGHGPACYHLVDEPHAHLVCQSCGMVVEVPTAKLADLTRRLGREFGFVPDYGHFAILGDCESCRPAVAASSIRRR